MSVEDLIDELDELVGKSWGIGGRTMVDAKSMEEILDGFIGSQEFTNMCARYGIDR